MRHSTPINACIYQAPPAEIEIGQVGRVLLRFDETIVNKLSISTTSSGLSSSLSGGSETLAAGSPSVLAATAVSVGLSSHISDANASTLFIKFEFILKQSLFDLDNVIGKYRTSNVQIWYGIVLTYIFVINKKYQVTCL